MSDAGTPAGLQVLIVDDEPVISGFLQLMLADAGYQSNTAINPDAAIKLLEAETFCLLLTDIVMPGFMDGWDLAREARRLQPGIAVIYMSGYSNAPRHRVEGSVYMQKPFRGIPDPHRQAARAAALIGGFKLTTGSHPAASSATRCRPRHAGARVPRRVRRDQPGGTASRDAARRRRVPARGSCNR